MRRWLMSSLLLLSFALSGCATKQYGRMEPLAEDAAPSDCAALAAQLAETDQFRKTVARESQLSGADVVAFLIDFGIGNAIEKNAALKSADEREARLKARQREMTCGDAPRAHAEAQTHY